MIFIFPVTVEIAVDTECIGMHGGVKEISCKVRENIFLSDLFKRTVLNACRFKSCICVRVS